MELVEYKNNVCLFKVIYSWDYVILNRFEFPVKLSTNEAMRQ